MTFSFHPEANAEFFRGINHYEKREKGLGYDFSTEVYSAIQSILENPGVWPIFDDGIRRCLTKRFPYGILYSIEKGEIFILAVMHLRRRPDYWRHRH